MKKLTEEQFLDRISSSVEILTPYLGHRLSVDCRCRLCHFQWTTVASILAKGHGCPECGKCKAAKVSKWNISQKDFLDRIPVEVSEKVDVISPYTGCRNPVEAKCKICGREWTTRPINLYKGHACDFCSRKAKGAGSRLKHDEFAHRVAKKHQETILLLSVYTGGRDVVLAYCMNCDHQWSPQANRLYRRGCPNCIISKGEAEIERLLESHKVSYTREHTFDDLVGSGGRKLRFDFAVWDESGLKCLVEFDGEQHYRPILMMGGLSRFEAQRETDGRKNSYCTQKGIRLIRITGRHLRSLCIEDIL